MAPFTAAVAEDYPELHEALDRIHRDMSADTATVLLLDRTRTVLETVATIGLDPTLRGARRVPLGAGFAGRVAATRQPVFLNDVTAAVVINPVLLDHGVRSLLGVPIMDGSELRGVLHVGFLRHHELGHREQRLLSDHADTLGKLLRHHFKDSEHTAALALQRSLLPTAPTAPDGLEIAVRYVPADGELGGDWYDVFELPDGRFCLVIGDVVGHGLDAAIVMGRLRSALRSYALDYDRPDEVLTRLDRKICHFEPGVLATVLLGIARPPYDLWHFSSAGHFPPVIAPRGEAGTALEVKPDPLLGIAPDHKRHSTAVTLPHGGRLCLFTDGLIERRPAAGQVAEQILEANLQRVEESLADAADPEMACIRLLTGVVGDVDAQDDIAVLVAQRS